MTELRISRLETLAEAEFCARMMAASEPWLTLGRGSEALLKALQNPAREPSSPNRRPKLPGWC